MNLGAALRVLKLSVAPKKSFPKHATFLGLSDADGVRYSVLARRLEAYGKLKSDNDRYYFTDCQKPFVLNTDRSKLKK